jgi:CheY-like chemotaxis protein
MHKSDQPGKELLEVEDDTAIRGALMLCLSGEKPIVLVVDDDEAVGLMLGLSLRRSGFVVQLAASGPEALPLYRENRQSIALVLLDVQMPGMDGPATLAAIQTINPEVQCCFMSGQTGKYSTTELLALGAAHVLTKPFVSLNVLSRLLWDMVGAS